MFPKRWILALLSVTPCLLLLLLASATPRPPGELNQQPPDRLTHHTSSALTVDFGTYINANNLLMFVTNKGSFAFDNSAILGKADGLYYPYTGLPDILDGINNKTVIYCGSLWVGGVDATSGDTLVTSGHFITDWGVGPLVGGAPVPGADALPQYRVYKLYRDSLADNPNTDYLEWPAADGAPVDDLGNPAMRGDQMLWSVYNDLDVAAHNGVQGTVGQGLGLEVQQTVWASDQDGDFPLHGIEVTQVGLADLSVRVDITDPAALTGHDYQVETDTTASGACIWRLIDVTQGLTILDNQVAFNYTMLVATEGFQVRVETDQVPFSSFEVVANGAGPLDPPESCGAGWAGFPVPTGVDPEGDPTENQQVGEAEWLIHTGDNGGTSGGGDRQYYESFVERTFRADIDRFIQLGTYDWEMRFTGSNDNPGVGGSYAWPPTAFGLSGEAFWVPFELWRVDPGGANAVRCIPYIYTDGGDSLFWMSSYGSDAEDNCGPGGCEHSVDGGDDDPYTDWLYWCVPNDQTPGEAAYLAFETAILADGPNYPFEANELRIMDRLVLVSWDGHSTHGTTGELLFDGVNGLPIYSQDLPEPGTVFRLVTNKNQPLDAFTFSTELPSPSSSGPEGVSVYARFKMINKGGKNLQDVYTCIWFDPDLGAAHDDLVGCDVPDDIFYCYNGAADDPVYGSAVPATGAKIVEGPIVPAPGETAYVDGLPIPDYRNLGMYSHSGIYNPNDPDNYTESYRMMTGLAIDGSDILDHLGVPTRYFGYGDPTMWSGFLDTGPGDKRMMATVGPLTLAPNDTQQVVIKIAAGRGSDRLISVSALRDILNSPPDSPDWDGVFPPDDNCPDVYNPDQEDWDANGIGDACDACCVGHVGDVNGAGGDNPTIGDVSLLIDALFISVDMSMVDCLAECDVNMSGTHMNPPLGEEDITIGDLSLLIDLLFITVDLSLLEECP